MARRTVLALSFLTAATPALGQLLPVSEGPAQSRRSTWAFDIGAQMAQPIGDFRSNVNQAWGFGGSVRYHLPRLEALGLRADFTYLNYGNETKNVPFSPTVNRVRVDMRTSNNIVVAALGPELMATRGPVRPYLHGFAGYSYFYTESSANDEQYDGNIASTTNFDDGGWALGWGAGLKVPLRIRSAELSVDGGARYTQNGIRSYLVRGDIIDLPDGSLAFTPRTTRADFWQYHLGVSISPRRRRQ
jgi:hypothetical protein